MNKLIDDSTIINIFIEELKDLILKYPFVRLSHYGFPDQWEKLLNIG